MKEEDIDNDRKITIDDRQVNQSNRGDMFFDYDFVRRRRSTYVSATAFYPLWAGLALCLGG